ncbi:cobyrinic acid a,c-diamide synthase [Actinoplanes octamycinicus]|uniref:Cobyrinic acid a,c-diamide synthase n=1 Tax=Actinoplanes octamycinicus TaxID=135948 RepID=A0A7W7M713_9ACTN|nr:cobyrinate a,c-diamide synthase [Actinoplanes octamycinicus]MBB4739369.1 cobyrinic acid a,c-diamide synthase [Actinoplanes octamycinicus]
MSAPASGHGKTAIAVGLLAAMAARGVPTAGFKVGPDHTDAAYLGLAAGRPGRNLDPRLVGAQRIAPLFGHGASGAQLSVIEGAMGLFDSLTGQPEIDGTAAVAATLRAPVALVVDVAAMGHSLAALVHGFRMFDEMVHLGGVILNRVASPRHEQMLRSALDDIGMPVLGALRRGDLPNVLPSRAHGLVPVAHRTVEAGRAVRRLGEAVAGSLDLDRLMALANSAPPLPGPLWTPAEAGEPAEVRPVVALAGGPGAPYTYVETAELLTAAGADVVVVDPLRDESLPPGTRALIVGSGLPEGYAEELSANRRLCADVATFAREGWPVVAEGVALPWLGRDLDGRPMCGVLDITGITGEQTVAGYREATAPGTSVLAPAGARITGYKQHRALVTPRAGAAPAWTWSGGNPEGFVWRQVHASQLGLHWAAAPEIAKRLVAAAIAGPSGQGPQMSGPPQAPSMPGPAPRVSEGLAQPVPMPMSASLSGSGQGGSGQGGSGQGPSGQGGSGQGPGIAGPGPIPPAEFGPVPVHAGDYGPSAAPAGDFGPGPVPTAEYGPRPVPAGEYRSGSAGEFVPGPPPAREVPGPPSVREHEAGEYRPGEYGAGTSAAGEFHSGPVPGGDFGPDPRPGGDFGPDPRPGGEFGSDPRPGGEFGSGPLPAGEYGPGQGGHRQGTGPAGGHGSGPLPAGPSNGPVPGMAPAPGMGPANGPVPPRPGSGMPNGGPVHGNPGPGPSHGPDGTPDNRPTSDIPIPS